MSGASVPYALRQNKFVDRRIFIDLLGRIERYVPLDDHVYISMGGPSLEDHRLAHAQLGLTKLLSIDGEDWVIARQRFNKPVDYVKFLKIMSGDLIAAFSPIMRELGFGGSPPVAMWLDFTTPKQIRQQVGDFNKMLDLMQPLDVLRVTVNASPRALYTPQVVDGRPEPAEVVREKRFKKLRDRLGDYLPPSVSPEDMDEEGLARTLARSFEIAAKRAYPGTDRFMALPLSLLRYSDSEHQMLSITVIVLPKADAEPFIEKTQFRRWPFFSSSWADVHKISIPYLTMRERLFINERIPSQTPAALLEGMGFYFDDDAASSEEAIAQYCKYYRFYPHFHYVVT